VVVLVTLKVSGVGCASCVAPVKEHFLRAPGALAVHLLGSRVYVVLEDGVPLADFLDKSGAAEYYVVYVERTESLGSLEEALERIRNADRVSLRLAR